MQRRTDKGFINSEMKKSGCFFVVAARSRKVVQLVQSDRWQPMPGRVSSAAAKQKQSDSIDRQQQKKNARQQKQFCLSVHP